MKRTYLIIGANSSIARQLTHEVAKDGANVILAGRSIADMERLSNDISVRYQVKATPIVFDALDYQSHESFYQECLEQAGELDAVIIAVGYLGDQKKAELDALCAKQMIETNYNGVVSILQYVANDFAAKKRGTICVISSVAGDRGRQSNYFYGSAKGALTLFLQGLRNRLHESGVHVMTVKPGFVDTKMTFGTLGNSPLVATPEKVAAHIYKAMMKRKDVVYTPFFWKYIMLIIRAIPETVFKRLKL